MFEDLMKRSEPPAHNPTFLYNSKVRKIIASIDYNNWQKLHDCIILLGIIAEEQSNKGSSFFEHIDLLCGELYSDLFFDPSDPEPDKRGCYSLFWGLHSHE